MKDLSPEARALIASHRSGRPLTEADRARMKKNLLLRVSTLGATTAVASTAAGMSLASKVVLVALGVSGIVGAGAVSLRALRSPSAPTATLVPAAREVAVAPPAPEVSPPTAPTIGVAPPGISTSLRPRAAIARASGALRTSTPKLAPSPTAHAIGSARPASATTTRNAVASATSTAAAIDERPTSAPSEAPTPAAKRTALPDPEPELRAVREAREDLRAGRPASAYRRLEDLDRQSRGGMLVQERSALAAIALCQSQPGPVAQARATDFLLRSPESPLATRVRAACEQARRGDR